VERIFLFSVNPKSVSNQSSKSCTVLQYPSRKERADVGFLQKRVLWGKIRMYPGVLNAEVKGNLGLTRAPAEVDNLIWIGFAFFSGPT